MKKIFILSAILPVFFMINPFPGMDNTKILSGIIEPGKVHILLLVDDDYGANFNIDDESMNIAELFESFGWQYSIVSLNDTIQPCEGAVQYFNRGPVATDLLV